MKPNQIKEKNLDKIFNVLKDHPDIKKLKPEDEFVEIDVTLDYEADAEEFKEWADNVYQLLLKHPNSLFSTTCVTLDDEYAPPKAVVGYNRKESQEAFESRLRRVQENKLFFLFSDFLNSKYNSDMLALDLFLKNMLKIPVDEFVKYLKEVSDNERRSSSN